MGKFTGVTWWRILSKRLRSLDFISQTGINNSNVLRGLKEEEGVSVWDRAPEGRA